MPEQPVRVFVSHHHSPEEDAFTARLADDLRRAGAVVWIDVADIRDGDFMERINSALASSDWVVLVLTPASLVSQAVRMEINAALNLVLQGRLRGVIPVMAERCETAQIPPTWSTLQRYDATLNYAAARDGLVRGLQLDQSRQDQPPPQREETADDLFARYFVNRPDLIMTIEQEAERIPTEKRLQAEKLLLQLELETIHPEYGDGTLEEQYGVSYNYFARIADSLERVDATTAEAVELARASRQRTLPLKAWDQAVTKYLNTTGGGGSLQQSLLSLGESIAPLLCSTLRQLNTRGRSSAWNYPGNWKVEVELALLLSRMRYFPALCFFADLFLEERNVDAYALADNSLTLAVVTAIRSFGASPEVVDRAFTRLIGISASEIVKARSEHEQQWRQRRLNE